MSQGEKERKARGVKTLSETARPLTSAYVYTSAVSECGH